MMIKIFFKLLAAGIVCVSAVGCATKAPPFDYTAFKQSRPRSILVLPPVNNSTDVGATYSFLSQVTFPLAESGYYVFPVSLVDETFKQNGLANATDIHQVSVAKLRDIFGADSALYVTITKYGSTYTVLNSVATVSAEAKLVDLKSGGVIWSGTATANSGEGGNSTGGGLIGALVAAAVKQILNNVTDVSHRIAGVTSQRLLTAGTENGILYGPRSMNFDNKSDQRPVAFKSDAPEVKSDNKTTFLSQTQSTSPALLNSPAAAVLVAEAPAVLPAPKTTPVQPRTDAPKTPIPLTTAVNAPAPAAQNSTLSIPTTFQTIEYRSGVSSASVEKIAQESGCTGGKGAALITEQGPVEVYRMQCNSGKVFLAKCELRQCSAMR